jgi:hypothetical protein
MQTRTRPSCIISYGMKDETLIQALCKSITMYYRAVGRYGYSRVELHDLRRNRRVDICLRIM